MPRKRVRRPSSKQQRLQAGSQGARAGCHGGVFLSQSGDNATGLRPRPSLLIFAIKADKRAAKVEFSPAPGQSEAAFEDHTGTQEYCRRWGEGEGVEEEEEVIIQPAN